VKRSNPLTGVKKRVVDVPAYTLRAYEAEIKLNQNESPYDFPEDLKEEVVRIYREKKWSRYPDFVPDSLRASLARFAGWKKEGILVGNGSNELLQATLMVFVREHTPVAIPSPTFTVYGLVSTILGATILHIPLNPDMSFNVDELIARSNEAQARVLVICTPNNPTGTVLSEDEARRILDNFSGHVLLDDPRLIITRTFSKAMGMAGLRVGYLMAHPDLVVQIDKAKLPYNINQFSLTAAQVALDHVDRFQPAIQAIISERERLGKDLAEMPGVRVYPSGANFFLFEVPTSPGLLFEELYQQGILIRNVSRYPMLSKCLRVAVGTPEENSRFLTALRQALAKAETGATSNC
jgi:histidinol-phosphate aminotransferase